MERRTLFKNLLWGGGSFLCCLALYLTLAFLVLGNQKAPAGNTLKDVPKERENFAVLLSCEELSQFCAINVFPKEERISAVLFESLDDAKSYREHYDRKIEYTKMTEIDVIGRIGGIVIERKNSYNDNLESEGPERLFGSRVLEFAKEPAMRADIAKKLLLALLTTTLNQDDFNFIFSTCKSDVSFVDFCEYFPLLQAASQNITVMIG